ncbi:hypothetical protein Tco_0458399, partial [Tanacetum coccineum]
LELVQETTNKVVLIKEKLKAARDCQKSYADNRRKLLEFEVGDQVMLKMSPWKGVIRFGKRIKVDKTLRFVEKRVENSNHEVKRLKCSRMVVVKVHLGSKARSLGPQFLFDELRYRVVNGVVTQLKVLTSLLDDGQGSAEKPLLTFEDLMSTPIDFLSYAMNRLKLNEITREVLVGPVYNLLKGNKERTCSSSITKTPATRYTVDLNEQLLNSLA